MLLQIKLWLITLLYIFGILFVLSFPPRNYKHYGSKLRKMKQSESNYKYNKYLQYDDLRKALKELSQDNPEITNLVYLNPKTYNNRSLIAIELRSDQLTRKPGIFIVGGMDAMAWGAPNAIMSLAYKLLYDPKYQVPYFNEFDWYLIPMANPDGIQFTQSHRNQPVANISDWTKSLILQKTHRPTEWHKNTDSLSQDKTCFGTFINRNFAYHFSDFDTMPDPCSQVYPGPRVFSSKEAEAIRRYLEKIENYIQLAINLHASFKPKKDLLLYPWRYTKKHLKNYHTLQRIGEYAARESKMPDGRLFQVHQSSMDEQGLVSGTLIDYLAGVVNSDINLVYLLKPYHVLYPNFTDIDVLETYMKKTISATLGLVRGWRSSNKQNILSFFGKLVQF